jgi:adenylate cyclase
MRRLPWKPIALGILVGVAGLVASPLRVALDLEEDVGLGLLFKLRGPVPPPRDAVVVSIDRESSERLHVPDNPDKWPRSLHARLTEALARAGAKVVSFDVHFIEPRIPEDDAAFAGALKRARNVLLTEPIRTSDLLPADGDPSAEGAMHNVVRVMPPIALLSEAAVATAPFTLPRIPFKVSRFFTFEPGAGDSPSVPMVILQLFTAGSYGDFVRLLERARPALAGRFPAELPAATAADGSVRDVMKGLRALFQGDPSLPETMREEAGRSKELSADPGRLGAVEAMIRIYEGANNRYINYYGPPRTIATIPYHEALGLGDGGTGHRVDVKGKAVFVGLSEALLAERKDSFYTVFSRANGTFIGGVEISATAFANTLEGTRVRPVGLPAHVLLLLLWGIAAGILCRHFHVGIAAAGLAVLSALYLAAALYRFRTGNVWLPLVVPLLFQGPLAFLGGVVWNHVDTKREQERIRSAFEQYLPKNVVDQLLENLGDIGAASETVFGVCLFTDAEQYTTLSETMGPKELGAYMNRYYETLFRPVKKHGGVVSNLAGDSMLAIWVSATPDAALRDRACRAAIEIQEELDRLCDPSDPGRLRTRIGLHYGDVFLGNIGSAGHYQHSVMGDIVNTASRIEGLNKHLGTRSLVSDEVVDRLEGFLSRELGTFRLKGKSLPVVVHELAGLRSEADGIRVEAFGAFAEGLRAFRSGSFDEAASRFRRSLALLEEDEPSRFYLHLCERLSAEPPEGAWDGVVHMDRK